MIDRIKLAFYLAMFTLQGRIVAIRPNNSKFVSHHHGVHGDE